MTCILFSLGMMVHGQTKQVAWENLYSSGSFASRDRLQYVLEAESGNYYVAGEVERDISHVDAVIFAFNAGGELRWKKTYSIADGAESHNVISDICIDRAENIYVLGTRYIGQYSLNRHALKFDSTGTLLWERDFAHSFIADLIGLTADDQGNCYMLRHNDAPLFKLDPDGKLLWKIDPGVRLMREVVTGPDNHLYVLGNELHSGLKVSRVNPGGEITWVRSYPADSLSGIEKILDTEFDQDHNLYILSTVYTEGRRFNRYFDVMISRIDTAGKLAWQRTYGSAGRFDEATEMKIVGDSLIFVGGHSMNDSLLLDAFLLTYDSSGALLDTFIYDSEFHESDYHFSFDVNDDLEKYLTIVSFVDDYSSFTQILKVGMDNQIIWKHPVELSLSNRIYPERCMLTNNDQDLMVFGNLRTTVNPELSWDTNSDFWFSRITTEGEEVTSTVYGEKGTSLITDTHITLDPEGNAYVSGKMWHGPMYEAPKSYKINDYFLNKIDPAGQTLWSLTVNVDAFDEYDYIGHFPVKDSLIVLVGNLFAEKTKYTLIDKYTPEGEIIDRIIRPNRQDFIQSAIAGSDGSIYTFEETSTTTGQSVLRKYTPSGELAWEHEMGSYGYVQGLLNFDLEGTLLLTYGNLLHWISESGEILRTENTTYSYPTSLLVDDLGNIFALGYNTNNTCLYKYNPEGGLAWSYVGSGFPYDGMVLMADGGVSVYGRTCNVVKCPQGKVVRMGNNMSQVASTTYNTMVYTGISDRHGHLYLAGDDGILEFDGNLNHLSMLNYPNDSLRTAYTPQALALDSSGSLLATGTLGNTVVIHYSLWAAMLTMKYNMSNHNPEFETFHEVLSLQVGESLQKQYLATDPDGDPITYASTSLPNGLELDSITGVLSARAADSSAFESSFILIAKDGLGGIARKKAKLRVGNMAPFFDTLLVDSVAVDTRLEYMPVCQDPEFDLLSFYSNLSYPWLYINPIQGTIRATPATGDTGVYHLQLWVLDEYGAESHQDYSLTVYDPNAVEDPALHTDPREEAATSTHGRAIHPYPNPFSSGFSLDIPGSQFETLQISLVDATGRVCYSDMIPPGTPGWTSQDLKHLEPGMYTLILRSQHTLQHMILLKTE